MRLNRIYITSQGKAKMRPPYRGITCCCGNGPWIKLPEPDFGPQGYRCQSCGGIDFGMPTFNINWTNGR
jgi:hypothetical protein